MKKTLPSLLVGIGLGIGAMLLVARNPFEWEWLHRLGHLAFGPSGPSDSSAEETDQLWTCSMHPQILRSQPGSCPICGMDLVPARGRSMEMGQGVTSETPLPEGAIRIDPLVVQNIGVRTEPVRREDLTFVLRTLGRLTYDPRQLHWVNTKVDGWIEKVQVSSVGEPVKRGQPLAEIYSPELLAAQKEYLQALSYRERLDAETFPEVAERAGALVRAARERLTYWDVGAEQIAILERDREARRRVAVLSPVDGVVVEMAQGSLEGIEAKRGMNLYRVVELSKIWAEVELYENQIPWVTVGKLARIIVPSQPGRELRGRVRFLHPYLDEATRTLKASIELDNPGARLRAEMYVDVTFDVSAARDALTVSESAVLHSGQRNLVVQDLGEGRFRVREVDLGTNGNGRWEVRAGLTEADRVVTSAQFLIDSESNLQEAMNKMTGDGSEEGAASAPMSHPH